MLNGTEEATSVMDHKMGIFLFCFSWIGICQAQWSHLDVSFHSIMRNMIPGGDTNFQMKMWSAYSIAKEHFDQQQACEPPEIRANESRSTVDAFYESRMFAESTSHSQVLNDVGRLFEDVVRTLRTQYNISSNHPSSQKCPLSTIMTHTENECNKLFNIPENCASENKYRSFDGSCNNLKHPNWGMASSCFEGLLPPVYSDGISKLRKAVSGKDLPNPRKLSVQLHDDKNVTDDVISHMFNLFGQFVAHDMAASPLGIKRFAQVDCCNSKMKHPECIPIHIEKEDPFYPSHGVTCVNAFRTAACPTCKLGPRLQTNVVTPFIDGSMIYGLTKDDSDKLRNMDGTGTLKSRYVDESGELPPSSFNPSTDGCSFQATAEDQKCFQTGDQRANMHRPLTVQHTLFLRQHNRIAKKLQTVCDFDEETIFQETRRIVIAQLQMITYNEYLPLLLGPTLSKNLFVRPELSYTKYEGTVNPAILNEFAAGAFRFAHTQIYGDNTETKEGYLGNNFYLPFPLYKGELNNIILSFLQDPSQKVDRHVTEQVTNHMYKLHEQNFGLDLVMLDIFRGRDHGVPPYVQMLKSCGGPDITSFDQLNPIFHEDYVKLFQEAYESVEDIDLFSGGLAEKPTDLSLIGPTFACIIETQFHRTKFGDRFYFEHSKQAGSFTPDQLLEIKKTSYAKILCENSDVKNLQKNPFLLPKDWNPNVSCSDLPDLDVNAWCPK